MAENICSTRDSKQRGQTRKALDRGSYIAALSVCAVGFWAPSAIAAPARKSLHGHVPEISRRLAPKSELPAEKQLSLAIGLPLRDEAGLEDFLRRLYDPEDPAFHQYLTPEQFTAKFGPTAAQYEQVVAFARSHHLSVTARHGNRLVLTVIGSVADVQQAFNINLKTYAHPTENRDFYAPDTEPSVDEQLSILDVSGLNNCHPPRPHLAPLATGATVLAQTGSGPNGTFRGNDLRAAYAPGVNLTGAGQILGLVQFDGFYASDITAYLTAAGLPPVPLQTVLLDGYNGVPTTGPNSGNSEVSLDIEMAISMAPGLSKIMVFEAGPNGLENDVLSSMASHSEVKQLSCSWGWGGGPKATTDNIFKQMAAQGQSFFSASGDSDAFPSGAVDDPNQQDAPSSCPYITVVGGTSLTTTGPGGAWVSESVWNRGSGVGSSGGISSYYGLPSWQAGMSLSTAGGSASHRNIPDVACVAENIHVNYGNGNTGTFGGTSCAAPLWAAYAALMNEQATKTGKASIGFLNPTIYALGQSSAYAQALHDVLTGNNNWSSSPNAFSAVAGYDLCTGWGSPAGVPLIEALAGPLDPLSISPTPALAAAGPGGGPFSPETGQLVLTNSSSAELTWSLVSTSAWLNATSTGGTLASGTSAIVPLEITSVAASLAEGTYTASLTFSNATSQVAQNATCTLAIGQSIIQNGGFETGTFDNWNLAGKTIVNGSSGRSTVYNAVESNSSSYTVAHSGNYGAFLGDTQLATLSQSVPTIPGYSYLLSFWLNNPKTGAGQHFRVDWDTADATNSLYTLDSPPVLGWTNLHFVVTASGTNSLLQFAAENDPNGFGLDDISLKPLPQLLFTSVNYLKGSFSMNWFGGAGVHYQVQSSDNVLLGPWTNLGDAQVGTGQPMSLTDTNNSAPGTQRFYRLAIVK